MHFAFSDPCAGRLGIQDDPVSGHRLGDVLDVLIPKGFVVKLHLAFDLLVYGASDAYTAWFGDALQPRRYIDAVAIDVVLVDDDITQIESDAHLKLAVVGPVLVSRLEVALDVHCARQGLYDTGKVR